MESGQRDEQERSDSGSTKREKESPPCHIDGHLSSQECGVGTKAPKIQRTSRAQESYCERRLRCMRGMYRTRTVCFAKDGCKSSVVDVIARLPGYAGQAADAVSACNQEK